MRTGTLQLISDSFLGEYANEQRWILWKYTYEPGREKPFKKPCSLTTGQPNVSFQNPANRTSLSDAFKALEHFSAGANDPSYGIGFILNGDGIVCVDLDNSYDESGNISAFAQGVISQLKAPTELSVSGKGLHIWVRGRVPEDRAKNRSGVFEVYADNRFIAITGDFLSVAPRGILPSRTSDLERLLTTGDDDAVLAKVLHVRKAKDLWEGAWDKYPEFPSQSEADISLCRFIANHTDDRDQIDRLFQRSGLYRSKWDNQAYKWSTIDRVLEPDETQHISTTDIENAKRFVELYGQDLRYSDTAKIWYHWDGTCFRPDTRGIHYSLAMEAARIFKAEVAQIPVKDRGELIKKAARLESKRSLDAVVFLARSMLPIDPEDLDSNPWLFNVRNGTIEMHKDGTYTIREHRRSDLITKVSPVNYDPDMEAPRWNQFLNEVFQGNTELIRFVQQMVGYSMLGVTFERVVCFCVGGTATGKTTFLETIAQLLGDGYAMRVPSEFFMARMFDKPEYMIAQLHGVRFAYASESEEGRKLASARIKELSGNDRLSGRHPAGRPFSYKPSHMLWLATNHLPTVAGTDTVIYERLRTIPFDITTPEEKRDKFLNEHLANELSGILNWALEGFKDLMRNGLTYPEALKVKITEYREDNDLVGEWFNEEILVTNDSNDKMPAGHFYTLYSNWCKQRNENPLSVQAIGRWMTQRGYRSVHNTTGRKEYRGIRFKVDAPGSIRPGDIVVQ